MTESKSAIDRISAREMSAVLSRAVFEEFIGTSAKTAVFYDLARLKQLLNSLRAAFPPSTLHAVALKANPAIEILKLIQISGHGIEVASVGELNLALAACFAAESIVFDSPVKTHEEIELALRMGVGINANSLNELGRIKNLYSEVRSQSKIGIRINPETGHGFIDSTSVAVHNSKFGVPLQACKDALADAFNKYDWLTGVHVHIGSQGMSSEQLVKGVGAVYDFFLEAKRESNLKRFNLGGGLPAKYKESERAIGFFEYASALALRCPALFDPDVSLVTEFGRALHASCGWVASRIEYIVQYGQGTPTILTHVGADMFLRKAYRPEDWHHDISVCDSQGRLRTGPQKFFSVAGPLCFAGDYLDRAVLLPEDVCEGDYVLIHDAGAYTFSMWSLYNSRLFPSLIAYEGRHDTLRRILPQQSTEDIIEFWSPGRH